MILLIVDDVWDRKQKNAFAVINNNDLSASKIIFSTRISELVDPKGGEKELKMELAAHQKVQKRCPNVAKVFDLYRTAEAGEGFEAGSLFLVMDLFPEGSLYSILDEVAGASATVKAGILHSASKSLKQLHETATIHRDVAARNFLVRTTRDKNKREVRELYLADFGLAGAASDGVSKKPWRISAPEAVAIQPAWSRACDVWSFGFLIFEVFSGQQPWPELKSMPSNFNKFQANVAKYHPRPEGMSDGMWALMDSCWSPRPDDRPTMAEVEKQLRILAKEPEQLEISTAEYN